MKYLKIISYLLQIKYNNGNIKLHHKPYLRIFRGIIPPLIGFDLSPLLGFILLTFLVDFFSSAANIT